MVSNIGILILFKYYDLFASSINSLLGGFQGNARVPLLTLLLPVGVSFYTFKIMNYTIDVYRGTLPAEPRFGSFALFVAFFPQLISGPIDRAARLLPQFRDKVLFDYDRVTAGLNLMLWGFFQKLVIADSLATLVDPVFDNPTLHTGPSLVIAAIFFTFQIYCDFSGYSDIAIGAAQVLGFTSMNNFDSPYLSRSIPEFWRRWHISLSSWFRDYLYIPLGGNRASLPRWYLNLFLVFLISGLWHGSNWTFAVWGSLHGCYYLCSLMTSGLRSRINAATGLSALPGVHRCLQVAVTFLLVAFAWIFFRAASISDALYITTHLFSGWGAEPGLSSSPFTGRPEFFAAMGGLGVLAASSFMAKGGSAREALLHKPLWVRWALYYCAILAILLFGNFGSRQFIYFQF